MRPCFAFKNAADDGPAVLSIYDEIGFWGVQASDFRAALSAVKASAISLEINSPGGDVFAGIAIYNMLKASGKTIKAKVMGVAASAASLIAMAGDTIEMPKNTFMMIHNPWSVAMGNAEDLRETAGVLDKIGDSLLATYVNKTGMDEAEMKALLSKDTWLTADEALAMGFATEVSDEIKAKAAYDLDRADLPAAVRAAIDAAAGPTEAEIAAAAAQAVADEATAADTARVAAEAAATTRAAADAAALAAANTEVSAQINTLAIAAGLTDHAAFLAVAADTLDAGRARIAVAVEIRSLCAFAKRPADADAAIRANKTLAEVRTALVEAMASEDVDTSSVQTIKQQSASNRAQPTASTGSIWAARK